MDCSFFFFLERSAFMNAPEAREERRGGQGQGLGMSYDRVLRSRRLITQAISARVKRARGPGEFAYYGHIIYCSSSGAEWFRGFWAARRFIPPLSHGAAIQLSCRHCYAQVGFWRAASDLLPLRLHSEGCFQLSAGRRDHGVVRGWWGHVVFPRFERVGWARVRWVGRCESGFFQIQRQ